MPSEKKKFLLSEKQKIFLSDLGYVGDIDDLNPDQARAIADEMVERYKSNINVDLHDECVRLGISMRKNSVTDWKGDCPKCGDDCFHVFGKNDRLSFRCYTCHEKIGDAIDFIRWIHGVSFASALVMASGGDSVTATTSAKNMHPAPPAQHVSPEWKSAQWQERANRELNLSHNKLFEYQSNEGGDYLLSRGIESESWLAFRLGFNPCTPIPGEKQKSSALVIPWIIGGKLRGIRYRFLDSELRIKASSYKGSRFSSVMFGGHVMGQVSPQHRTLVICEGELNAISIWQVANGTQLDVLSMGSESAKLSRPMIDYANQYDRVVVWADEERVTKGVMSLIPRSHGITSPGGKDANDMLQDGNLGRYLSVVRHKCAETAYDRERLLWSLFDRHRSMIGLDNGSEEVMIQIADSLGRTVNT